MAPAKDRSFLRRAYGMTLGLMPLVSAYTALYLGWRASLSVAVGAVLLVYPGIKPWPLGSGEFYAWVAGMMSVFVAMTIFREFYKGARARAYGSGENFVEHVHFT